MLRYCDELQSSLAAQSYAGNPIRAKVDDRDMRGGEKTWQHIKKGVPIRAEVGPRDVASDSVFVGRRDLGVKEKTGIPRAQFVDQISQMLGEIQQNMFDRALQMRQENTRNIDSFDEFKEYFTPQNEKKPEVHGGFAMSHWCEDPQVHEMLKPLKVTIRCVPLAGDKETGTCIFTGKPSQGRAVFAKAY